LKNLADGESLTVAVDNIIATQNLEKMCTEMGLQCAINKISDSNYVVMIGEGLPVPGKVAKAGDRANTSLPGYQTDNPLNDCLLVMVSSALMGSGDDKLGTALMKAFIFALAEGKPPKAMVFYNGGAKLTAAGAPTTADLKRIEASGAKIYTCGACINYFGLDTPVVGTVTDMYAIVEMMNKASKIIRP